MKCMVRELWPAMAGRALPLANRLIHLKVSNGDLVITLNKGKRPANPS